MKRKAADIIKYVLSLALAVFLVWYAFRSVDWKAFLEGLKMTRWIYLIPFFVASIGALVFRAFRWRALLRSSGHPVSYMAVWDANNVGNLANVAIPGAGELLRCGYVTGKAGYGNVFGTVVMERVWDVLAIILMIVGALFLDRGKFGPFFREQVWTPLSENLNFSLWWLVVLLVVLVVAFFWAVYHYRERSRFCKKIADSLSSILTGFASFRQMKRKWLFFLYTVGIWTMYFLMCFSIQKAVPELESLGVQDAIFFTAVGNLASIIPVPGGIGAYHYLVAISASTIFGASWETGLLFATLQHELHAILVLLLGALSYIGLSVRKKNS